MYPRVVDLASVARTAVVSSLNVEKGEKVWVHGWDHTIDLVSQLLWTCRKLGADVQSTVQPEDYWLRAILESPLETLKTLSPYQSAALEQSDVFIFTLGPRRPIPWDRIPAERRGAVSVWLDPRYDRSKAAAEFTALAKERGTRMLGIEATLATKERAEADGLDHQRWSEVMYEGCMEEPRLMSSRAKRLVPLLAGDAEVHVSTSQGTGLTFTLDRRAVDVSDGAASKDRAKEGRVTFLPAGGVEVTVD